MPLFAARYLLPMAAPPLEDGALLVEGGRILAVGPRAALAAAHPRAAVIACGDAVILPPLVNAHTHLELTHFPGWSAASAAAAPAPRDFVDWIQQLVRVRRQVDAAALGAAVAEGVRQSLLAGTGAVGDILSTLAAVTGYAGTPLRGRVFAEVLGLDRARVAARLAEIAAALAAPPAAALQWGLSPHAPYTLNPATLGQVLAVAREHRLPLASHWAETVEERDFLAHGGGPMAARLYPAAGWPLTPRKRAGAGNLPARLPAGSLLVHGVHASAAEIEAVAGAGLRVVLCPRSNARFGTQRAPVAAYRRAGVPLALGTDSLASSPSLSVWEELAFAREWFAGALDPLGWLAIATAGGAAALGLGDRLGGLQPGREASFQVVAVPPGAAPATLAEALCAAGAEIAVHALYLGGENVLPPR
jgi:cytosine/adenosine deaminase-related metal-dependent hydrolase